MTVHGAVEPCSSAKEVIEVVTCEKKRNRVLDGTLEVSHEQKCPDGVSLIVSQKLG